MRGSWFNAAPSARTSANEAKSATCAVAAGPIASAAARSFASSRLVMITRQPRRTSSRAVSKPMPELPPVMTAVFIARSL